MVEGIMNNCGRIIESTNQSKSREKLFNELLNNRKKMIERMNG